MPTKLQLKLTSHSGELLSLVTCHAGRISVFRAATPSDLRPYQRALSGSDAKDNIQVLCDGVDFQPEHHVLIGFGEPSPTTGLSVKELLAKYGVAELAMNTLLLSIGLEAIMSKNCSELSPDQEARLRLIAATTNPEKVVVLNDPFENIANQWRERAAELLGTFARSRNAIVVIPCLTYRPESWIDNQVIDRIEVGQTSQRTIGFGSADSPANSAMSDLRDQLRKDPRFAGQMDKESSTSKAPLALAAAVTAGISSQDLTDGTTVAKTSKLTSLSTITSVITGASVLGLVTFYISRPTPGNQEPPNVTQTIASVQQPANAEPPKPALETKQQQGDQQPHVAQQPSSNQQGLAALNRPSEVPSVYVLDLYPQAIKASILDTFSGNTNFAQGSSQANVDESQKAEQTKAGNLFALLEKSGQEEGGANSGATSDAGNPAYSGSDYSDDQDNERREAIRQRFLEAIREAAERRAQAAEEY